MTRNNISPVKCIDIELAIFRLYDIRQHVIVPNVSDQMGLVPFETDMLVLTQSGYATGFEIKVSKSDLLADLKKKQYSRFRDPENGTRMQELYYAKKFKYFYYAVPKCLEEAALNFVPEFIGLYVYEKYEYPTLPVFRKAKEAKKLETSSWSANNQMELMRLGTMRICSLKHAIACKS